MVNAVSNECGTLSGGKYLFLYNANIWCLIGAPIHVRNWKLQDHVVQLTYGVRKGDA